MTSKRLILVLLVTMMLALAGFAQSTSIQGRVEDAANAPVAGATVTLRNRKTGLERIVTTNKDGEFTFPDLGSDGFEAIVTANGFARTTKIIEAKGEKVMITLQPSIIREEVTVVSGSRQEELRESLNTKVDVLTRNDLKTTGYETVGEALREVPGVITRRGSETSGPAGEQVQGIDSRQVLVLLDGQPLVGARGIKSGVLNLDRQSTARLESVEVVKGAASSLYGSDAIGGVINLRSREQTSPFSASITFSGGTFGVFDGRGDIGFLRKQLSGIFSFERHKNNGFDLNPATFVAEGTGFHRYDAYGKLKYQFNDKFSLLGFANSYWDYSKGRVRGELGDQTNDVNSQSQNYGVTADWVVNSRTTLQARGYFARFDEITRGKLYPSNTILPDGNLFERYGKFDATVSRVFGERQFVQAGVEFTTDRYSGINRIQNDKARADTQIAWLQDKINLFNRLTVTVGGRFDHHSIFGSAFSPKVGLNYRVNEHMSLRASYGRGFRAPDLGQLFFRFSNPTSFYQVIGNPGLIPETAGSWQIGGEFNGFKRKARFGVNLFRNDVKNLINSRNLGLVTMSNVDALFAANGIDPALKRFLTYNVLLFYYQNLANIFTEGIEADGSYILPKGFAVSGAYTYLMAKDKTSNRFLTGRNRHQGFVKVAYENTRLGFNANFRGSLYSKWISSRVESTNLETIAAPFQIWDIYGAKHLPKGFEVYGTINNIFNNQDPNKGTPAQIRLEAGRSFRIGIRWNFDRER